MQQAMPRARVLVITGLPGTGKTTLAQPLAARLRWPLLAKDAVKQPLMDRLVVNEPVRSRQLSDVSFELLFTAAGALLESGCAALILEGNFRAGEHEAPLARALARAAGAPRAAGADDGAALCAQILCRIHPQEERYRRLAARAASASRDESNGASVHADVLAQLGAQLPAGEAMSDRFLEIPGPRLLWNSSSSAEADAELDAIERWVASQP
jgi:predicted kinase